MFCSNCGKQVNDNVKFCPFCGACLQKEVSGMQNGVKKPIPKKGIKGKIIIVVLIIALLLTGGAAIKLVLDSGKNSKNANEIETVESEGKEVIPDSETKESDLKTDESIKQVDEQDDSSYLALVRNEDGKYGYINEKGEEVIACQYDIAYSFEKNGLAAVGIINEGSKDILSQTMYKWGLINAKGEMVVPMIYDDYLGCAVRNDNSYVYGVAKSDGVDSNGTTILKWGLIDSEGDILAECQYAGYYVVNQRLQSDRILNDKVMIARDGDDEKYVVILDLNGNEIVSKEDGYLNANVEEGELIAVEKITGYDENSDGVKEWGYINIEGEEVIPFQYAYAYGYGKNGLAAVSKVVGTDADGKSIKKSGFINTKGEVIIPFEYGAVYTFYNGLAAVRKETGNGYSVNDNGRPISSQTWGYINGKGEEVTSFEYSMPYVNFKTNKLELNIITQTEYDAEGYSTIRRGVIDQNGKEIVLCVYGFIIMDETSDYMVIRETPNSETRSVSRYGIADQNGDFIIPFEYNKATLFGENGWAAVGYYTGEFDELAYTYQCRYIDKKGSVVLELPKKYIDSSEFVSVKKIIR